jgi:tetratricopeptide (TPR) repeat protein
MSQLNRIVRHRVLPVLLLGFLTAGCGRSPKETVNPETVSWKTPTDEECQQFVKSLEENVCAGNADAVISAIDLDAVLDRASAGIEAPEERRRKFIANGKRALTQSLTQGLQQALKKGGYRFLRMQHTGNEKQALFRVFGDDSGLNYHRLVLGHTADRKVRAVDIYGFASGELLSQTMRRMYLPMAAEASKSLLAKLTQSESDFVKHRSKLVELSTADADGRSARVLEIYATLPPSLQKDKTFLLARMKAAAEVSEKEYADTLDAFRDYYPADPCLDILLIDHYFLRKQFDRALACIDTLDKAVGGDPYLNVMRANVYLEKKDFAKARECAQKAVAAEENLQPAYWALITASLGTKDFAETSRLLTAVREKCGVEIDDLAADSEYAEYVKSPEYNEWLKK